MDVKQAKMLAKFQGVLAFLDQNVSLIPPAVVATQRQVLSSAISQIQGFAQDQVLKGTESVLSQTVSSARVALRDTFMRQLSTVALQKLVGKHPTDPNVPNAQTIFALPATRTNALTLIKSAQDMLTAATPYAAAFTAASVSLDAVKAAIDALQTAVNAEGNAKRVAQGATKGIPQQIEAGQGAVRLMDVVIRPLIATNKPVQTQWAAAKRSAGGSALGAPVAVPSASQPATTTTAASTTTPAATASTTTT